jgi:methane/ammonia monooxygenase subunit C
MSFITSILQRRPTDVAASHEQPIVDLKPVWLGTIALCAFFVVVRIYEQFYGWSAGMDANSREFEVSWMTIFYFSVVLSSVVFVSLLVYLWTTRDRDVATVAPREELRRTFYLLGWILLYGLALAWGTSFFTEQDAMWHSATLRDSSFTPVNIVKFYVSYPIYIIIGAGGFMYARTRLPTFACKGFSIAYTLLFFGPFMILPSAGLNEWGHTFWVMEELSVAPLNWTFVFFGWFVLAVFGVLLQILGRLRELCADGEAVVIAEAAIAS